MPDKKKKKTRLSTQRERSSASVGSWIKSPRQAVETRTKIANGIRDKVVTRACILCAMQGRHGDGER